MQDNDDMLGNDGKQSNKGTGRGCPGMSHVPYLTQVNKKFRKFESKYRDCIKRNGDKIGTQTCYVIST